MSIKQTKFRIIPFLILLFATFQVVSSGYSKDCHYSCTHCFDASYTNCIICKDQFTLKAIRNADNIKLYYDTLQEYPSGLCIDRIPDFNLFGLILFLMVMVSFVFFRNRTLYYFINTMQTFALLSLIQIGFLGPISYVLQAFQYFMLITSLNRPNKIQSNIIYESNRYRMYEFINAYDFKTNFSPLFIFSIVTFAVAFLIPVCKHFAKKQGSIWSICNCFNLQKVFNFIEMTCIISFLFLIQQCILMISIGIFLDNNFKNDGSNIVLVIVYAIILGLMITNICSKNLDIFPNKAGQQIQILKKCVIAPFVVLPVKATIALVPFMLLTGILGLVFNSFSSKQKVRTQFHDGLVRRQLKYRIVQLLVISMVGIYYLVQKSVKSYSASNIVAIVTIVVVAVYLSCLVFEIGIELYGKCWVKEQQKLYKVNLQGTSSMRQGKMLQQTLENFQSTEQGIMDMLFFSRNVSPQKQSPHRKNIKLNIDIPDQSEYNITEDKQRATTNTSPLNREQRNKSRTARTPKNDRSSRFRINKIFDPQNQTQIQKVQVKQINLHSEDVTNIQKSQRSEIPKTSRRQQAIKTTRQIRVEVCDTQYEKSPRFAQKSPRFAEKQEDNVEQQQQFAEKQEEFAERQEKFVQKEVESLEKIQLSQEKKQNNQIDMQQISIDQNAKSSAQQQNLNEQKQAVQQRPSVKQRQKKKKRNSNMHKAYGRK